MINTQISLLRQLSWSTFYLSRTSKSKDFFKVPQYLMQVVSMVTFNAFSSFVLNIKNTLRLSKKLKKSFLYSSQQAKMTPSERCLTRCSYKISSSVFHSLSIRYPSSAPYANRWARHRIRILHGLSSRYGFRSNYSSAYMNAPSNNTDTLVCSWIIDSYRIELCDSASPLAKRNRKLMLVVLRARRNA